jgi:hypothetical protein
MAHEVCKHAFDVSTPLITQAVDPDIDTLPLLAWSTEMANTVGSAAHRGLLRVQHYFFFPILLFSRFSWCEQSVSHNLGPKPKKVRRRLRPGPAALLRAVRCMQQSNPSCAPG